MKCMTLKQVLSLFWPDSDQRVAQLAKDVFWAKFLGSSGLLTRGGDSHMKQTGMLAGSFEFNP